MTMTNEHRPKLVCAHYLSNYLTTTMNWLYPILRSTNTCEPIIFARSTSNLDSFPMANIYALSRLTPVNRAFNLVVYKSLGYFPHFRHAGKKHDARLLHVHMGYDGWKMLPLKRKLGVPMVTGFYGIDASKYPRIPKWRQRYRTLFAEGECFLALGPRMREALMEAGCPDQKLKVFNIGIHLEDFPIRSPRMPKGDEILIVMGASFREKKGIPYALEAVAILRKRFPRVKLLIAGDGELRQQIEQQRNSLGLSQNVDLPGYVPPHSFRKLMESAHIVILPSVTAPDGDTEGTPYVLFEALAMGIPVVSTYHADIPEVVTDGVSGYLVPERDSAALAERLIHLIEHPESWSTMGKAGREHVARHFNAATQFEALMQLYSGVIGR